jgi:hypothetical protein
MSAIASCPLSQCQLHRSAAKSLAPCRQPNRYSRGNYNTAHGRRRRISQDVPSVKWLMASFLCGFCARNFSVTSGSPSLIMRCTMIKLLNTMVHVESRSRFVRARKISATPASPACVATRMCSTYFDLGAASYMVVLAPQLRNAVFGLVNSGGQESA